MPLFTYVGDAGRYYPQLGLSPEDDVYELEAAPTDGRWLDENGAVVADEVEEPADESELPPVEESAGPPEQTDNGTPPVDDQETPE